MRAGKKVAKKTAKKGKKKPSSSRRVVRIPSTITNVTQLVKPIEDEE